MKKLKLICLIILGSTFTMKAQWTYPDANHIATTDTVTIGGTPSAQLSVWGAGEAASYTNGVLQVFANSSVGATIGGEASSNWYSWLQSRDAEGNTYRPFAINPNGGNVAVGLIAPASLFHSAGRISTGIPNGGLGGASATTGSMLFYNSTNTNTVNFTSGVTSTSYSMILPLTQGGASEVLTNDGSGNLSWSNPNTGIANMAWLLTGNTGTIAPTSVITSTVNNNFIGTKDAVDFAVATNNYERLRVTYGGKVGIGVKVPKAKLHVSGGDILMDNAWYLRWLLSDGITEKAILNVDAQDTTELHSAKHGITFKDNNNNFLALMTNTGKWGLGTPTPASKLDVEGGVSIGNTYSGTTAAPTNGAIIEGSVGIGTNTPSTKLQVAGGAVTIDNNSAYSSLLSGGSNKGILKVSTGDLTELHSAGNGIKFMNSSNAEKARMDNNGNWSIGTTSTSYKLDVQLATTSTITVAINTNGVVNATNYTTTSDKMFKKDVDSLHNALAIIHQLNPKSYYFDTEKFNGVGKFAFQSVKQYGFIAQEVETILPELVSYSIKPAILDTLGNVVNPEYTYRALNYNALISILTKGVQELDASLAKNKQEHKIVTDSLIVNSAKQDSTINSQNAKIAELQNQISNCCTKIILDKGLLNSDINTTESITDTAAMSIPILYQNNPNPFNHQTNIQYFIPTNAQSANVMIFDLNGKLIKTISVSSFGNGTITINGNELTPGMFIYSLIVDEKIIDTKRMILTN